MGATCVARLMLSLPLVLAVPAAACAQITSSSTVHVLTKPNASPQRLGAPGNNVVARGYEARWEQHLDELQVTLLETRACAEQLFVPVVRMEQIERRADGALYWEYGLGAVLTAVGVVGLLAPQALSSSGVNGVGEVEKDLSTGYRLGGVMGTIGVLLLASGAYDSVRARDETRYTDAYRAITGEPTPCAQPSGPSGPMAARTVELIVGDHQVRGTTDATGVVRLRLPAESSVDPAGTTISPTPSTRRAAMRLGPRRAFALDFVVPYGSTHAQPHRGEAVVEPLP